MDSIHEKPSDESRALLFELLVDCRFPSRRKEDCPIWEQRNSLSLEKKHEFALGLSDKKIKNILLQHESCYEKRLSELDHW